MNPEIAELLKNINIEAASEAHIEDICRLANFSRLEISDIIPQKIEAGFLIYTLDAEQYSRRINPYFYVANALDINGFLMCYDKNFLQGLISDKEIDHESGVMNFLNSIEEPFVFGDQICLAPNMKQLGIGSKLMNRLFEDMKTSSINNLFVTILHKPIFNNASYQFCQKLGAQLVAEVENNDSLTWGIYRFDLDKINVSNSSSKEKE